MAALARRVVAAAAAAAVVSSSFRGLRCCVALSPPPRTTSEASAFLAVLPPQSSAEAKASPFPSNHRRRTSKDRTRCLMRPRGRRRGNGGGKLSPFVAYSAASSSEVLASDSDIPDSASDSEAIEAEEEKEGRTTTATASAASSSSEDEQFDEEVPATVNVVVGRAAEIASVAILDVALPILSSAARFAAAKTESNNPPTWDDFWSSSPSSSVAREEDDDILLADDSPGNTNANTNAALVASGLERLGPTYVKFGQALASRPDVVPPSLAAALSKLQDDMEPFDTDEARRIIKEELMDRCVVGTSKEEVGGDIGASGGGYLPNESDLNALLANLSPEPVAAASIGQVYRGHLPGYGKDVAVKVQRPGVRDTVRRDFALLRRGAALVESLPAVPILQDSETQTRLVSTELVAAVDEFMSRIFEELDYRNEASNAGKFGELYSDRGGTAVGTLPGGRGVRVPEILKGLCTENVLVMEWIEGTKLTDVGAAAAGEKKKFTAAEREENLALLELAIQCTLSQLLETGVMHADPHGGNLLKVPNDDDDGKGSDGKSRLAYLDFGLLSTVPAQVRDGLVCAVAVLIFARDVDAVAGLFGELQLLPEDVLTDPVERAALHEALSVTLDEALTFPDGRSSDDSGCDRDDDDSTEEKEGSAADSSPRSAVPYLKFDKLLDALARLVPRFRFELPPYFVNNARALSTLEGIARSLDPDFNVLRVMYPFALNRMLRNPTGSEVVDRTLSGLIAPDEDGAGAIDVDKATKLLNDSAAISGHGRGRVLWDVVRTRGGQRFVLRTAAGELRYRWRRLRRGGGGGEKSDGGGVRKRRRKRRRRGRMLSGDYFKL